MKSARAEISGFYDGSVLLRRAIMIFAVIIHILSHNKVYGDERIGETEAIIQLWAAVTNKSFPQSFSVHAMRSMQEPERSRQEVRRQLESNYSEMIALQGSNMVESVFPSVDAFEAWYYREGKEKERSRRDLEDRFMAYEDSIVFEQTPLNPSSEVDDHAVYASNLPDGRHGRTSFEINHDKESCQISSTNKWKYPPYISFGTYSDRDRFLIVTLIRSCDTNLAVASARLTGDDKAPFKVSVIAVKRDGRDALEFSFHQRIDGIKEAVLVSKWVVDRSDLRIVYEATQYANGQILDSIRSDGFSHDKSFKYPSAITVYESNRGGTSRITEYIVSSVSTNDFMKNLSLYSVLKQALGEAPSLMQSP